MAARSRRGRGYIEPLPSGSYRAVVPCGMDPLTGRRRNLRETAATSTEAQVVLTKLQRQVDENKHPKSAITMPARLVPLPTRTTKIGDGFVVPPGAMPQVGFIQEQRGGGSAYRPLTHPLGTLSTSRNHGLVIPYRKGHARPTGEPMLTLATRDSAGLLLPAYEVDDCWYRMIQPREQLTAQCFPDLYIAHGTKGEQTMQAGNAVSCNVAQWIAERVRSTLYGLAA